MVPANANRQKHTTLLLEPDRYSGAAIAIYHELGAVWTAEEIDKVPCEEVTILVVRLARFIDEDFLQRFPRLHYLVSPTTGLNHIDLNACSVRNIHVVSLKGETAFLDTITSTAEHTLGLMLALLRRLPAAHRSVIEEGEWLRDKFATAQISSLTTGIVGLGRIGRQMRRYLECLGSTVRAYDIDPKSGRVPNANAIVAKSLGELFAQCDIVTVHADYRPENRHLIGREILAKAKPGMLLINTSRGELLDEQAVVEALQAGRLRGAAVDVLEGEHHGTHLRDSPLIDYARAGGNVIVTPHIAGCTRDAMAATEDFAARRLAHLLGRN